jgi:chemotaxis protein MotB
VPDRRRKPPDNENHERWLVSYADFITLLFAFFVVMFASSQTDKTKAKQISQAVEKALSNGKSVGVAPSVSKILGGTIEDKGQGNAQMKGPGGAEKAAKEVSQDVLELAPSLKSLSRELEDEIKSGKVELNVEARGVVVGLKQAAFFPSGTDFIDPSTFPIIAKVARVLNEVSNSLQVEGHTDSVPIHTPQFHSNYELSAARSIAMMELLATHYSVDRQRMIIVGFADTSPEATNETAEGRAANRRVNIVILNQFAFGKAGSLKNK